MPLSTWVVSGWSVLWPVSNKKDSAGIRNRIPAVFYFSVKRSYAILGEPLGR